jgi:glycine betaine/proline transport system substrate-binding protein
MVALVMALVASCGSSDEPVDSAGTPGFEAKPTINLVVNDWTASALNVAIAEQLIENHLGYPVVPTRMDDTTEIYDGLADGSVDAVLEIWPSTMDDRDRRFFDAGLVENIGGLGSVGKVGWWVPRYVVDADPALATWEGLSSTEAAARFATEGTAPNGRFLGTNESYEQYDQQLIDALGLPLTVEFSGSEAETKAQLEAAVAANEPILLYWWTPTAAVAQFDLVNVALPEPSAACVSAAAVLDTGQVCDYPEDHLFKAVSPQLETKAPDVLAFLTAFTLTTEDQLQLLNQVEYGGSSIGQAASQWITANTERWQPWLDQ